MLEINPRLNVDWLPKGACKEAKPFCRRHGRVPILDYSKVPSWIGKDQGGWSTRLAGHPAKALQKGPGRRDRVYHQTVNIGGINACVFHGLTQCKDTDRADRGLGIIVPSTAGGGMTDTDGGNFSAVFPNA